MGCGCGFGHLGEGLEMGGSESSMLRQGLQSLSLIYDFHALYMVFMRMHIVYKDRYTYELRG